MKRRIALSSIFAMTVVACSLGLNESLIHEQRTDASVPDSSSPSDGGIDSASGSDGSPDTSLPLMGCTLDSECTSANACLTGHCDTAKGQCAFDLCPASACSASACDPVAHTCGPPTSYGFKAATIPLAFGVGCGGSARSCVAASYPFVFVGTTQGVIAIDVADPALASPPLIAVSGVPFFPVYLLSSGTRVYFVGPVATGGPMSYMVPIAWIDPPTDPTVTALAAQSAFVTYPTSSLAASYGAADAGLFVEGSMALSGLLTPPIKDPSALTLDTTPLPAGESIVGASAGRLVGFRVDSTSSTYAADFSLVMSAGGANPTNGGEQDVTADGFGKVASYTSFAGAPDGSFLFLAATYDNVTNSYPTTRLGWVLADGTTTTFSGMNSVTVETYTPAAGFGFAFTQIFAPLAGPVAWVDPNRALLLAAAHEGTAQTSVQVASRAALPPTLSTSRFLLNAETSQMGAAGSPSPSSAFGYVLTSNSANTATLQIVAPDCP